VCWAKPRAFVDWGNSHSGNGAFAKRLAKLGAVNPSTYRLPKSRRTLSYVQLVALLEPIAPCSFLLPVPGLECQKNSGLDLGRLDFKAATMLVSECAVNGRIGRCKTEDSMYEVPLDADLAQFSLDWKCGVSVGLVFPSARTGGCQHADQI
jgi:hypothetical protein